MTPQKVHDFREQVSEGEAFAKELDVFFSTRYEITRTPLATDKLGIDRIFTHHATGKRYSIEYKSDSRAASTGNAFVEIVSVSENNTPGWAKTCLAQWIIYYIPPWRKGYWIRACTIKARLEAWERRYPTGRGQNRQYASIGILVPLWEIEVAAYARKSFVIPG
jgi:hypothetical protein